MSTPRPPWPGSSSPGPLGGGSGRRTCAGRGASAIGEVEAGRRGVVRVAPAILVPVRVTARQAGRSWAWKVGPVTIRHRVEPRRGRCVVAVDMDAPAAVERVLAVSYGPLVAVLLRNLARVAERRPVSA
jgi:hypothetical protein